MKPDHDVDVTISLEPIRWKGSPVLTWFLAGEAWFAAGLLALLHWLGAI